MAPQTPHSSGPNPPSSGPHQGIDKRPHQGIDGEEWEARLEGGFEWRGSLPGRHREGLPGLEAHSKAAKELDRE